LTADEIASGERFDTSFALGLHAPGRFNRVIDLNQCYLPSPFSVDLMNAFRSLAFEREWDPWNLNRHEGYLRHLVIRTGVRTGEVMVNLVTNGFDPERFAYLTAFLQERFPEVTTFVNTNHTGLAQVAIGEESYVGFGDGVIRDEIGGFRFEIAPGAFFQTNTVQAEKLYEVVREFSEASKSDLIYDLYCGAGTISIFMAPHAGHVIGVELVPEAVVNARVNAAVNHIENCTFLDGDLKRLFTPSFIELHGKPDVLIVDPPRAGMHPKVVEQIAELRPERFVYVSCNPQTQVRDLQMLKDVYDIEAVQPVDLFPHTYPIENVIKLRVRR
jgi:23S rRNA (uracil1939-C5)-methyltransferase